MITPENGLTLTADQREALITAHAKLVRSLLQDDVNARRQEHAERLAEHRRMPWMAEASVVPRFPDPRPVEPLGGSWSVFQLWRAPSLQQLNGHLRHQWRHRCRLRTWVAEKAEYDNRTAHLHAIADKAKAGDPQTLSTLLNTRLSALTWAMPVRVTVRQVDRTAAQVTAGCPAPYDFPSLWPAVAEDGRRWELVRRSVTSLQDEAAEYRRSVGLRLAAECFATHSTLEQVTLSLTSPGLDVQLAVYLRYRWDAADRQLANNTECRTLDQQMRAIGF